jgi:hypothetical protein
VSDPQDPLAALAAAAKNSPAPRRPAAAAKRLAAAPSAAARPLVRKKTKASPLPILLIAGLVLIIGIIVGVGVTILVRSNRELAITPKDEATRRPPPPEGPGALFSKVKQQSPSK